MCRDPHVYNPLVYLKLVFSVCKIILLLESPKAFGTKGVSQDAPGTELNCGTLAQASTVTIQKMRRAWLQPQPVEMGNQQRSDVVLYGAVKFIDHTVVGELFP